MFITVACGAISGFHCLVAGGTSSKQVSKESDIIKVGYGGMLLEGLLAIGVLVAVGCGLTFQDYTSIVFPTAAGAKSNPILAFAAGAGGLLDKGLGYHLCTGPFSEFCWWKVLWSPPWIRPVRLNRYLFEELWQVIFTNVPKIMKGYVFNSTLCVILMYLLAYNNAFLALWPAFGSANQLLASLALIAVSVWLVNKGKNAVFTVIPAVFMMATTLYSLVSLLTTNYLPKGNYTLATFAILLIVLSIGVIGLSFKKWREIRKNGIVAPSAA